ncbi:MAG: endonuclease III [Oscillospiraceae bacterium]|nr:endonuclease III [Oscillospiraceae bacterium]
MKTNKKKKIKMITDALKEIYPQVECALNYSQPYELLIAARLSAQCTDKRVNIVTKELFNKFPTLESFAHANIEDIEQIIKSCGLFHTKARDIIGICDMLCFRFGGVIPSNMEDLLRLPGVGRKTANLILGDIFRLPAVVTDTHCIRISNRLGLVRSKNPLVVERELREILEPGESNNFCHRLVRFGRDICKAKNPKCNNCPLVNICVYKGYNNTA